MIEESSTRLAIMPNRIGQFEIIREIGRGSMGVVWEAVHPATKESVAIKILQLSLQADVNAIARFYREIQVCQALSHKNIISILEIGEYQGLPYYVMPLVKGSSLAGILSIPEQHISARLAVHIALQVALALHHAHQNGVIHRDIKPSNIMVTEELILVTDFGLARPEWMARLTNTGIIVGTPIYMSPEQLQGLPYVDGRTDIYSLGVCLYEMVTRQLPFQANTLAQLFYQVLNSSPTPPHHISPQITMSLSKIILKCLSKKPQDRYATAGDLAESLRQFLLVDDNQETESKMALFVWELRKKKYILLEILVFLLALVVTYGICFLYHSWSINPPPSTSNIPNPLYYIFPQKYKSSDISKPMPSKDHGSHNTSGD